MKFKTEKIKNQFNRIHSELRRILTEIDNFCISRFNKEILITELERTQEEQDLYYAKKIEEGYYVIGRDGKKHYSINKRRATFSFHMLQPCRAADFRTTNFNPDEILELEKFAKELIPGNNKAEFLHHSIMGQHIHIQIPLWI